MRPAVSPPRASLTELFDHVVGEHPDALALMPAGDDPVARAWSYVRLDAVAELVAARIALELGSVAGGFSGELVGVCLPPSAERTAVFLAVLKLGAAYVPVDGSMPVERLKHMVSDTALRAVVTDSALRSLVQSAGVAALCIDADAELAAALAARELPIGHRRQEANNTAATTFAVMYTSGSTGRPKGVPLHHGGVTRLCTPGLGLGVGDVVVHHSNVAFDAAHFELWIALTVGACSAVLEEHVSLSTAEFSAALRATGATMAFLTPAVFVQHLRNDPTIFAQLDHLMCGGEAMPPDVVHTLMVGPHAPRALHNGYGPTEATMMATLLTIRRDEDPARVAELLSGTVAPIGTPCEPGTECFVVADDGADVTGTVGAVGHLYVAGAGVCRGYLHLPEITARHFVTYQGRRAYRTGDLVRVLGPDAGGFAFLGREDNQVKVRGHRIELEAIEAALAGLAPVVHAAVVVDDTGGDIAGKRLVAFLVLDEGGPAPTAAEMREQVLARLPSYYAPARFLCIDRMPLEPAGKVSRGALRRMLATATPLAAAEQRQIEASSAGEEPELAMARVLVELWATALRLPEEAIGVDDDFFSLGGHSLAAAAVAERLRAEHHSAVVLRDIMEMRTIRALAKRLTQQRSGDVEAEVVAAVVAAQAAESIVSERASVPDDTVQDAPLAWSQLQLVMHQEVADGAPIYNEPLSILIPEPVEHRLMTAALALVVSRHAALRLRFRASRGRTTQSVMPAPGAADEGLLELVDFSAMGGGPEVATRAALAFLEQRAQEPFDLIGGCDSLVRFTLARVAPEEHRLFVIGHHAVIDGLSVYRVLLPELEVAYRATLRGERADLPALPFTYADYLRWESSEARVTSWRPQLEFWRGALSGASVACELPYDHAPPPRRTFAGATRKFHVDGDLVMRLHAVAVADRCTMFELLMSAFCALLSRWTGSDEVCVATVVGAATPVGVESLMGMFLNTVVVRARVDGTASLEALTRSVAAYCRDAFAHSDIPFARVVEEVPAAANVNVAFVLEPEHPEVSGGWTIGQGEVQTGTAKFDLTVELDDRMADGMVGRVDYSTEVFDDSTAERIWDHFVTLLGSIAADAARSEGRAPVAMLDALGAEWRRRMLVDWQATDVARVEGFVSNPERLARHAAKRPDKPAILFGDRSMSYGELLERADALAARVAERLDNDEAQEHIVLLWCDRTPTALIGQFGVMRAGAAFAPVPPQDPIKRVAGMAEDVRASLCVCDAAHAERARELGLEVLVATAYDDPSYQPRQFKPQSAALWSRACYVMFTSGTTGRCKGVLCEHGPWQERAAWFATLWPPQLDDDVHLCTFAIAFDGVALSAWAAFAVGATVALASADELQDPDALADFAARVGATHHFGVPFIHSGFLSAAARRGLRACDRALRLRWLASAGEALPPALALRMRDASDSAWNLYGPTENVVTAMSWRIPPDGPLERGVLIGRQADNMRLYVLDKHGQLALPGAKGELYVGGPMGTARHYIARPDANAHAFVQDAFVEDADWQMYRTGDVACWHADGEVEFFGRFDRQVKLGARRIELQGIESMLGEDPSIAECVVAVRQPGPRIVAYVVATEASEWDEGAVRARASELLPAYMIPKQFTRVHAIPVTTNGKADLDALVAFDEQSRKTSRPENVGDTALTPAELFFLEAFREVLVDSAMGVDDDFYDLGGNSLLALQMVSVLWARGFEMRIGSLHKGRTARALAARFPAAGDASRAAITVDDASVQNEVGACPLLPSQRWLLTSGRENVHHFNLGVVLLARRRVDEGELAAALRAVTAHHGALRLRFDLADPDAARFASPDEAGEVPIAVVAAGEDAEAIVREAHASLDLVHGPVLRAVLVENGDDGLQRIVLIAHHLVVDGVSWWPLVDDLAFAFNAPSEPLPPRTASVRAWSEHVYERGARLLAMDARDEDGELAFWRRQFAGGDTGASLKGELNLRVGVGRDERRATRTVPSFGGLPALPAIVRALRDALNGHEEEGDGEGFLVWLATNGRDGGPGAPNMLRTVGWLAHSYPLRLSGSDRELDAALERASRGALAYSGASALAEAETLARPRSHFGITLNVVGTMGGAARGERQGDAPFFVTSEGVGQLHSPDDRRLAALDVAVSQRGGDLVVEVAYANGSDDPGLAALADEIAVNFAEGLRLAAADALVPALGDDDVVPLNESPWGPGHVPPLFLIHPAGAEASGYAALARHFQGRAVLGVESVAIATVPPGISFSRIARVYVDAVRRVQPSGPYLLGGWSLGGNIAHEVARQLEKDGDEVAAVLHIDSRPPHHERFAAFARQLVDDEATMLALMARHFGAMAGTHVGVAYAEIQAWPRGAASLALLAERVADAGVCAHDVAVPLVQRFVGTFLPWVRVLFEECGRDLGTVEAPAALARCVRDRNADAPHESFVTLEEEMSDTADELVTSHGWSEFYKHGVAVGVAPGTHENVALDANHTRVVAQHFREVLAKIPAAHQPL